jgi:hypothetical protein
MLKKINLSTFLLTKGVGASYYSVSEINFLFENLSRYKFSGIVVVNVEDFNEDYVVMVDEGLIVSVVFMGFEFEEISPIVLKNRYGEKNKITIYTMPSSYSDILRAFYRFENVTMNNVINNKKDMDTLLSILAKQNITGIINFTLQNQQYYILIKKGNPVLRNELINNGNLITSFYYYKEIIYEKILGKNKMVVNVFGLEDKQLEKIIEENEKNHMVVKELEVKVLKGWGIALAIRLPKIIYDEWYKVFELPPKMIKIDGYNEKLSNVKVEFDEKIESDSVFISEVLIKRIKVRGRPIDKGDKIVIIPQFE